MRMMTATRTEKFWARVHQYWPHMLSFLTYCVFAWALASLLYPLGIEDFPYLVRVGFWTVAYSLFRWKINPWLVAHYTIWMAG